MDLLQILSKEDLEDLAEQFGEGLDESQFVQTMSVLIKQKASEDPVAFATVLKKWKGKALRDLFQAIDYNQDGVLQYEELTNFAINSALHHTRNQKHRLELQFRDYQLVLPPQATSYGLTTVINGGNFTPMSDQILKGRGFFKDQSAQLKQLFYLRGAKKFVAEGFTRTTLHHANQPDCISRLDIDGTVVDVTMAHNNTYLVCSTNHNLIEVFEQSPSGISSEFVKRKSLHTDRTITQFLKADSGLGKLPGWFGGTGDREGLVRYCNMERLHAQLSLLGHNIDSLTILRRKIHDDEITSLQFMNQRAGGESIISSAHDNRIVIHDVETGTIRFEPRHTHEGFVRHLSLCNTHNVGFSTGNENYACMFNLDHVQHSVMKLEDYKDPHAHKLIGVHCVMNTHQVITADAGGLLKLWDVRQLRSVRSFHVPPLEVDAISTNQKMKHSRSSYGLPEAKPLPQSSARTEIQVSAKCNLVRQMMYCDETRKVYTIGKETTVFEYDASTLVPKAHANALLDIVYNPVEEQLVSASDTEIKIWNVKNGCCNSSVSCSFTAPNGAPLPNSVISCITVDHIGGKRMFVGSSTGEIACVIPATGKAEWCVTVRSRFPIVSIMFTGKALLVGFRDGFIASCDVGDPLIVPKVIFEPGTSSLLDRSTENDKRLKGNDKADVLSPSSIHRMMVRRRSKSQRKSVFDQLKLSQDNHHSGDAHDKTSALKPKVASGSGGTARYCVSHVLRLLLAYCPLGHSIIGIEFGSKSGFVVAKELPCPVTALAFIKESPWNPEKSTNSKSVVVPPPVEGSVNSIASAARIIMGRAPLVADPDSCELSVFAAGLASGAVHFYSIHMADTASRVATTLLLVVDVLDGVSINSLQTIQGEFLVAGCDSSELVVWSVGELVDAVDTFTPVATQLGEIMCGGGGSTRRRRSTRLGISARSTEEPIAPLAVSPVVEPEQRGKIWELRMRRVLEAVDRLQDTIPMGSVFLEDQTFVSHVVKIGDSGVVACASGELDSIVRVVTIDGVEVGLLSLGRTEEDAQDNVNSQKRNQQQVRSDIESQLLKKSNTRESPTQELEVCLTSNNSLHVSPTTRGGGGGGFRSPIPDDDYSPNRSPRARADSRIGSPRRLAEQSGAMIAKRQSPAMMPPLNEGSNPSSRLQSPGQRPNGTGTGSSGGGFPCAPYLWENIFCAREWRPAMDAYAPEFQREFAADAGQMTVAQRRNFIPPALQAKSDQSASELLMRIPELAIDFIKVQQHHSNEEEEGWVRAIDPNGSGSTYEEKRLSKELRKINRKLKKLEYRKSHEVEALEDAIPEEVRRLANMEHEEEWRKWMRAKGAIQTELDELHRLVAFDGRLSGTPVTSAAENDKQSAKYKGGEDEEDRVERVEGRSDPFERGTRGPFMQHSLQFGRDDLHDSHPVMGGSKDAPFTGSLMTAGSVATSPSTASYRQPFPVDNPNSLENLARRRQTARGKDLASQINRGHRGTVASNNVPAIGDIRQQALREHHTELAQLPHRLTRALPRQEKPALRQLSPTDKVVSPQVECLPCGELTHLEDMGPAIHLEDDNKFEHRPSHNHEELFSVPPALMTESNQHQQSQPAPPALPKEVGVRATSPGQFKTKSDDIEVLLRSVRGRKGVVIAAASQQPHASPHMPSSPSPRGPVRGHVHQSGELSTRGVLVKQEHDAMVQREAFKRQQARERLRMRKAHVVNPEDAPEVTEGAAEAGGISGRRGRSPENMERIRALCFPPIVPQYQPLQRHNGTGRTMKPIPREVAGMLRVQTVRRPTSPEPLRTSSPVSGPSVAAQSAR